MVKVRTNTVGRMPSWNSHTNSAVGHLEKVQLCFHHRVEASLANRPVSLSACAESGSVHRSGEAGCRTGHTCIRIDRWLHPGGHRVPLPQDCKLVSDWFPEMVENRNLNRR